MVDDPPLWKIMEWKSVRMMTFPIWWKKSSIHIPNQQSDIAFSDKLKSVCLWERNPSTPAHRLEYWSSIVSWLSLNAKPHHAQKYNHISQLWTYTIMHTRTCNNKCWSCSGQAFRIWALRSSGLSNRNAKSIQITCWLCCISYVGGQILQWWSIDDWLRWLIKMLD